MTTWNILPKSVSDVMLLSKGSGGIGASVTKLRAAGSPLKSNFGGVSTGPTPFAKIIDTAIRAIQRGGKKKGALWLFTWKTGTWIFRNLLTGSTMPATTT
jgi:ribonucleoside-diphosphate reductase alpha chain